MNNTQSSTRVPGETRKVVVKRKILRRIEYKQIRGDEVLKSVCFFLRPHLISSWCYLCTCWSFARCFESTMEWLEVVCSPEFGSVLCINGHRLSMYYLPLLSFL